MAFAYDAQRQQYYSTAILQRLERAADPDARMLGVTPCDLYVPVLTFVFGEAQLDGNCAVVSTARLGEEFYGLPPREELLRERLVKEAAHELGHTFGLRHCRDWRCVMTSSHAVERLDVKGRRILQRLPQAGEPKRLLVNWRDAEGPRIPGGPADRRNRTMECPMCGGLRSRGETSSVPPQRVEDLRAADGRGPGSGSGPGVCSAGDRD